MDRRIYLNQDDAAFMRNHPLEEMTVAGIERVVDYYARGSQLAGLAFCVNMQRALYDSAVWETLIDGYDPALGDDQPALSRSREARGMAELRKNGVDQFVAWVNRARHHGIEAFLTMRMNDCHGLEGHGDFWNGHRKKGEDQAHFTFHATEFWKKNPHLRRAPWRYERSFEAAFDYGREEVRRRQFSLIQELFERYDMDGLELDWMRWMFMFAPGGEAKGRDILSQFIADVDTLRKAAELRRGHRILLRHRVPADPQAALALGYDVPAWADRGLADHIILSTFGWATDFDYQIGIWRRMVGSNVKIIALAEPGLMAYPGSRAENYHFSFGSASSALHRGADGIYLFNECYRECGSDGERRLLSQMLDNMGSQDTLSRLVRRHAVSYPQVRAPGQPMRALLPVPLINPAIGSDPGRWAENITLRIGVGRRQMDARYVLCLGFSSDTPMEELSNVVVRINTAPIAACDEPEWNDCMDGLFPEGMFKKLPVSATNLRYFEAPSTEVLDDVNVIEFEPPRINGALEWAEILVLPITSIQSQSLT